MVLACIKDPRLQTEPQELVQSCANIGLALRPKQIVKGAHLSSVIAALGYLDCRAPAELAVPGGRSAIEITQGGDDGAEMGAFHDLFWPQRESNIRARLDEFLRFGLEAGIFYAS